LWEFFEAEEDVKVFRWNPFQVLREDFGSVECLQVWEHGPWKPSQISTLAKSMQHAENPWRLMSFNELTNLITKFLPATIEDLLQLETERERLTSLKEDLENKRKSSGWWFYMGDVDFMEAQIKLVEKQIKLAEKRMYLDKGDGAVLDNVYPILENMIFEHNHNALNILEEFHSRYPRDLKISQLLDKIKRILGFVLGVVVLFIYQYLMGYVETGRWNTYSNGSWEFRATYVCIELRLGSYPFQKFRVTPRRFGVRPKITKNSIIVKYEPWVWFRKRKIYFEVQKTEERAARIRDVAKYWLKSEGRDPLNFGEEDYNYLNFVQEFHPQQSDNEPQENLKIKRSVLELAQRFLKEDQQSQVPIVNQPPDVEPARFASKLVTSWPITF
jgi:hypothetical protein